MSRILEYKITGYSWFDWRVIPTLQKPREIQAIESFDAQAYEVFSK